MDIGEDCDDGNDVVGDGCNPDCRASGSELWTATVHEAEEHAASLSVNAEDVATIVARVGAPQDASFSNWWREYSSTGEVLTTGETPADLIHVSEAAAETGVRYWGTYVSGDGDDFGGWPLRVGGFDSTWGEVWSAPLDVGLFGDVFVGQTAVDATGHVLVGGASTEGPSFTYSHRGFTARFDSSGTQLELEQTPAGDGAYASACTGLAAAPNGRHATLCYAEREGPFLLRRYSVDGILELSLEIDISAEYLANQPGAGSLGFVAPPVAVNDAGDVAIAVPVGWTSGVAFPGEVVLQVVGPGGATTWETSLSGSGSLLLHGLALFADGALVAVGEDESADGTAGQELLLSRYDASGLALWATSDGSGSGDDRVRDVELDSQENILILGSVHSDATGRDLFVAKYTP